MTPADELRQRASEVDDEAWGLRWTDKRKYESLHHVADELRDLATRLNPPVRSADAT